jgi:hypothetical protein
MPSRLSKPQIIAATSRVTRSATKMTNIIIVFFFFLVFSVCNCTQACFYLCLDSSLSYLCYTRKRRALL